MSHEISSTAQHYDDVETVPWQTVLPHEDSELIGGDAWEYEDEGATTEGTAVADDGANLGEEDSDKSEACQHAQIRRSVKAKLGTEKIGRFLWVNLRLQKLK